VRRVGDPQIKKDKLNDGGGVAKLKEEKTACVGERRESPILRVVLLMAMRGKG